ncbi:MAG: YciI family protein [Leptospiraceae bacterium]|nr:GTP cyclohydrolase [Leptospiraceae bacterium]MCK6380459.1 YciI family protein [Leptospiraceae bacterium]NUM41503.1 GTP cyclohydrolase [Leptospiraceae bacterium]
MKHFLVHLNYIVPIETVDKYLIAHREFLDSGYEKGILLSSGPKNPRNGGLFIARAESLEELMDFCQKDPFFIAKCANYSYEEFIPVKFQKEVRDWFTK